MANPKAQCELALIKAKRSLMESKKQNVLKIVLEPGDISKEIIDAIAEKVIEKLKDRARLEQVVWLE